MSMQNEEIIYSYSRAEAISDGVLVDVSEASREAGIWYPVAVTQTVWGEVIQPDEAALSNGESESGRLWDCITMLRHAMVRTKGSTVYFSVIATHEGKPKTHDLYAVCGPGDHHEPVITIMVTSED